MLVALFYPGNYKAYASLPLQQMALNRLAIQDGG